MRVRHSAYGGAARLAGCLLALCIDGCGFAVPSGETAGPPSTLNLSPSSIDTLPTHHETAANNLLELAEPVEPATEPQIISGDINGSSDVDVYDLGPVVAGDRVVVEMTANGSLDAALALFDDTGAALLVNDHRNVYLGRSGPFVDVVMRRDSLACLLAVSATPGFSADGGYTLTSAVEFPVSIPAPRPDVILLDFTRRRGVKVGTRPSIDVPAFDAADIDRAYTGDTDTIAAEIVELVRDDYAGFNVTILSTTEGADDDGTMSRIHFGTFDAALLGVAEGVDEYNATESQEAMVFTDTFSAFASLHPSASEIAQAMANVASHEIGHLLGLVHTNDPEDLMDVTASLKELMQDQDFETSPIYSAVFPIGYQNSVQQLLDAVGGDRVATRPNKIDSASTKASSVGEPDEPPARDLLLFSGCGLGGH